MAGGRPRITRDDDERRVCKTHGLTLHRLYGNGSTPSGRKRDTWYCLQCKRAKYLLRDQRKKK